MNGQANTRDKGLTYSRPGQGKVFLELHSLGLGVYVLLYDIAQSKDYNSRNKERLTLTIELRSRAAHGQGTTFPILSLAVGLGLRPEPGQQGKDVLFNGWNLMTGH